MKPIILELPKIGRCNLRAVFEHRRAPVTTCEIQFQYDPIVSDGWLIKTYGLSVCQSGDTYNIETGLRLSLASALRKVDDLKFREYAWTAFLAKFPPNKRKKPKKPEDPLGAIREAFRKAIIESIERDMVFTNRVWRSGPTAGKVTWGIDHAKDLS